MENDVYFALWLILFFDSKDMAVFEVAEEIAKTIFNNIRDKTTNFVRYGGMKNMHFHLYTI